MWHNGQVWRRLLRSISSKSWTTGEAGADHAKGDRRLGESASERQSWAKPRESDTGVS